MPEFEVGGRGRHPHVHPRHRGPGAAEASTNMIVARGVTLPGAAGRAGLCRVQSTPRTGCSRVPRTWSATNWPPASVCGGIRESPRGPLMARRTTAAQTDAWHLDARIVRVSGPGAE
ncbi:hypothetical protein QJS66_18345 [Kocuria rhizophila]|nr:hypothetical protein QJS66_18345 [Kocuria rhizophila]